MRVALTGGIAAGKTTAMEILKSLGAKVFYADEIARNIIESNEFVISEIKKYFSEYDIAGQETIFDRKKLSKVVFSSKEKIDFINNLVHPLVKKQIDELFQENKDDDIVVEIPLLFEAKMQNMFDLSILIYASKEERINRCLLRNQDITVEDIEKRMSFQMDEDEKKKLADIVVMNQQDKNNIRKNIEEIWVNLKIKGDSNARRKPKTRNKKK